MEAIKAIAKRTKSGNYKIKLQIENNATALEVIVVVGTMKKERSGKQ